MKLLDTIANYFRTTYSLTVESNNTLLFKEQPSGYVKIDSQKLMLIIMCSDSRESEQLKQAKLLFLRCVTCVSKKLDSYTYYLLYCYPLEDTEVTKQNMFINSVNHEMFDIISFKHVNRVAKPCELSTIIFKLFDIEVEDTHNITTVNVNEHMNKFHIIRMLSKYFNNNVDENCTQFECYNEFLQLLFISFSLTNVNMSDKHTFIIEMMKFIDKNNRVDMFVYSSCLDIVAKFEDVEFKSLWLSVYNLYSTYDESIIGLTTILKKYILDNTFNNICMTYELQQFMCKFAFYIFGYAQDGEHMHVGDTVVDEYASNTVDTHAHPDVVDEYASNTVDPYVDTQCSPHADPHALIIQLPFIGNMNFAKILWSTYPNLTFYGYDSNQTILRNILCDAVLSHIPNHFTLTPSDNITDLSICEPEFKQKNLIQTLINISEHSKHSTFLVPKSTLTSKVNQAPLTQLKHICNIDAVIELGRLTFEHTPVNDYVILCLTNIELTHTTRTKCKVYDLTDYSNTSMRKKVKHGASKYSLVTSLVNKLKDPSLIQYTEVEDIYAYKSECKHDMLTEHVKTYLNTQIHHIRDIQQRFRMYDYTQQSIPMLQHMNDSNDIRECLKEYVTMRFRDSCKLQLIDTVANLDVNKFKFIKFGEVFKYVSRTNKCKYKLSDVSRDATPCCNIPMFGTSANPISGYVECEEYDGDVLVIVTCGDNCCGRTSHYSGKLAWSSMCNVYEVVEKYCKSCNLDINGLLLDLQISPNRSNADNFNNNSISLRMFWLYIEQVECYDESVKNYFPQWCLNMGVSYDVRFDLLKCVWLTYGGDVDSEYTCPPHANHTCTHYADHTCSPCVDIDGEQVCTPCVDMNVQYLKFVQLSKYFEVQPSSPLRRFNYEIANESDGYPYIEAIGVNNGVSKYVTTYNIDTTDPNMSEFGKHKILTISVRDNIGHCFVQRGQLALSGNVKVLTVIARKYDKDFRKEHPDYVYGLNLRINSCLITHQLRSMFKNKTCISNDDLNQLQLWLYIEQ